MTDWSDRLERVLGARVEPRALPPTVLVDRARWHGAVLAARDDLGCAYFDMLGAVDALDDGFDVFVHLADVRSRPVRSVMLRTRLDRQSPSIACVCDVFGGAGWHEREAHEMFGIDFEGHADLSPLLLPDAFEGHPLRKDFVLGSRVARPWPGGKEPGESDADASPSRRRMRPPGVPEPGDWPASPAAADDDVSRRP